MTQDQKRLMVLQALKLRLNGECSSDMDTCPELIADKMFPGSNTWSCKNCTEAFGYIRDRYWYPLGNEAHCPCLTCNNEEEPIIALEDEIERLVYSILANLNKI